MKKIMLLRNYFNKREDVVMAFLFGSQASQMKSKMSDWDIGVYFKPNSGILEWEETDCRYPQEDRVWNDLVDILGSENIDLVVLNRVPANIAASAISGKPLVIKDRGLFIDFMIQVMRQAEDYYHFVNDFYEISQRSISLTPRDKERLRKIISFLEEEMTFYDYFSQFTFADYSTDSHKRRDVERWIENIVNSSIDIGQIILASMKKKIPDYYKDIFLELSLLPQFKGSGVDGITKWVKLRNILAHEYLDLRWNRIEEFIKESRKLLSGFLEIIKEFVSYVDNKKVNS